MKSGGIRIAPDATHGWLHVQCHARTATRPQYSPTSRTGGPASCLAILSVYRYTANTGKAYHRMRQWRGGLDAPVPPHRPAYVSTVESGKIRRHGYTVWRMCRRRERRPENAKRQISRNEDGPGTIVIVPVISWSAVGVPGRPCVKPEPKFHHVLPPGIELFSLMANLTGAPTTLVTAPVSMPMKYINPGVMPSLKVACSPGWCRG